MRPTLIGPASRMESNGLYPFFGELSSNLKIITSTDVPFLLTFRVCVVCDAANRKDESSGIGRAGHLVHRGVFGGQD